MNIVNLNSDFKNHILDKNRSPNFPYFGIGIHIFYDEKHIFIPITSEKKSFDEKKDRRFFSIGKNSEFGTLLISSYIYIKPNLIKKSENLPRILDEANFLRSKEDEILKKLRFQINRSRGSHDDLKLKWLREFMGNSFETNKKMGIKYADKAIQSMAVIEKVKLSESEIDDVLNHRCLGRTDTYEVETIINLKNTWAYFIRTLENDLDLNYIIDINERLAIHQSLETGIIRNSTNSVSGEFEIPIPNEKNINRLIYLVNNSSKNIEMNALSLFYHIITSQWFFDGNKRTAFVIANKILLKNGIGLLIVEDKNNEKFNQLLYDCYKTRKPFEQRKLMEFLSVECVMRW